MTRLTIPDLQLINQNKFVDKRGYFYESFNHDYFFSETGSDEKFVQDNISVSNKNVLRGLHLQVGPKAQAKLVSVVQGKIFDVAVDVRLNSLTFGKYVSLELSSDSPKQLFIPKGFAHGFLVLSDSAIVLYKTSNYYSPEHERSILWNDKSLSIEWPEKHNIVLSKKDLEANTLKEFIKMTNE